MAYRSKCELWRHLKMAPNVLLPCDPCMFLLLKSDHVWGMLTLRSIFSIPLWRLIFLDIRKLDLLCIFTRYPPTCSCSACCDRCGQCWCCGPCWRGLSPAGAWCFCWPPAGDWPAPGSSSSCLGRTLCCQLLSSTSSQHRHSPCRYLADPVDIYLINDNLGNFEVMPILQSCQMVTPLICWIVRIF